MKATISGTDYYVSFKHTLLPGAQFRKRPTRNDILTGLLVADMIFRGEYPDPANGKEDVHSIIEACFGAQILKSHTTHCYIKTAPDQKQVSTGVTFCDKRDNFDRAVGRWLSFQRAIAAFPADQHLAWIHWFIYSGMRTASAAYKAHYDLKLAA